MKSLKITILEKLKINKKADYDFTITWEDLVLEYKLKLITHDNEYQESYQMPKNIVDKIELVGDNWKENSEKIKDYFKTISKNEFEIETIDKDKIKTDIPIYISEITHNYKRYIAMMSISITDKNINVTAKSENEFNLFATLYKFILEL